MREETYDVALHGEHVGSIQRRDDFTKFVLDHGYWQRPRRSVLGLWFENHRRERPHAVNRVPAWFSNLLPEGRLRELIAREQGVSTFAEIDLLARIGDDLPGAVTVTRAGKEGGAEGPGDTAPGTPPHVRPRDPRPVDTGLWRASLAGMTLKFSMSRHGDRLVVPAHGEDGDWILKTPDRAFPGLQVNELAIMRLAGQVGIDVPEVALWDRASIDDLGPGAWPSEETQAYAVRRFDRSDRGRIHSEDFAQVLGRFGAGDGKYHSSVEEVAATAYREQDVDSLREMVRRTVFNLLVGNGDAHLKNWSLIYPDRRTARLSPAYDLVCTAVYPGHAELGLPFFGARTLAEVGRGHFTRLQQALQVDPEDVLHVVDETVERFYDVWGTDLTAPVPPDVRQWVGGHRDDTRRRLEQD